MQRWTASDEYRRRLGDALTASLQPGADDPDAQRIADWLQGLRHLRGVPFSHLVPDARMLPPESIRFFWLDEDWVTCLIDGAFSLGRSTSGDAPADAVALTALGGAAAEPVTGFLLRSAVIAGWPAMEVRAYPDLAKSKPLDRVRQDLLAQDVLVSMFAGELACVTLSEPAETLHFGFLDGDPYKKTLKVVNAPGKRPGEEMEGVQVEPSFRPGGRRVLEVQALADAVHSTLVEKHGLTGDAPYTPAEFALELVEGVQEVDFPRTRANT